MGNRRYENFDLVLEEEGDGQYVARVTAAPAGDHQARVDFRLPFDETTLENLLLKLDPGRSGMLGPGDPVHEETAMAFGAPLFDAIFTGDLGFVWRNSLQEARKGGSTGLRLRLRLDAAPALTGLPWELLYDTREHVFTAQSESTPIVRVLNVWDEPQPMRVDGPLHVLAIISSPLGLEELNVEREWRSIQTALAKKSDEGLVVVKRLPVATITELSRWLRDNPTHILHFVGHGNFSATGDEGFIYFQDEHGNQNPVNAAVLGPFIKDTETLQMVVLNACRGARNGSRDPYGGMAQGLVLRGAKAVVAMQFPISDKAAARFSTDFYDSLSAGLPVDQAVGYARKNLQATYGAEWATPVLFMRSPDGNIFENVKAPPDWVAPPAQQPVPVEPTPRPIPQPQPQPQLQPQPQPRPKTQPHPVPVVSGGTGSTDGPGGVNPRVRLLAAAAVVLLLVIAGIFVAGQILGGGSDSSATGDDGATDANPTDSEPTDATTSDTGAGTGGLPDMEMLVAAGTNDTNLRIYRVDENSGVAVPLTEQGVKSWLPVLSPDRRTMVYVQRIAGTTRFELFRGSALALDLSSQQPLLTSGSCDDVNRPAWSPTAEKLVLRCKKGSVVSLVQVGENGGTPVGLLTLGEGEAVDLTWIGDPTISADGSSIVFFGNSDPQTPDGKVRGDGALYRYDVASGDVSLLLAQEGQEKSYFSDPVFSPDGQWLAWRTNLTPQEPTTPDFEVYAATFSPTGGLGTPTQISAGGPARDQDPNFSNDNKHIAYASWTSSTQQQIFVTSVTAPEDRHELDVDQLPSFRTVPAWGTGR